MSSEAEDGATEISALRQIVDTLTKEILVCKHPGCCCVCGHQQKCPEDGTSVVSNVHD